jgi:hypothetical protein
MNDPVCDSRTNEPKATIEPKTIGVGAFEPVGGRCECNAVAA